MTAGVIVRSRARLPMDVLLLYSLKINPIIAGREIVS